MQIGSLNFQDSAAEHNRFAQIDLDASVDKNYSIQLAGTDNNGDPVTPLYVVIDNYNNAAALSYSVDNFNSSLAPYTTVALQVSPQSQRLTIAMLSGQTTIFISEKKLPVTEGTKYQQGTTVPVGGTQILFITAGATFVVPATWNVSNNKVHCIGPGADGLAGSGASNTGDAGGGGGYARRNNMVLTPGAVTACQIGAANSGNDTWVKSTTDVRGNAAPPGTNTGGPAGAVGSVTHRGGNGTKSQAANGGGGGGAAGSTAVGGDALNSGLGGASGEGNAGGAIGSGVGSAGTFWAQTTPVANAGPGGGGGGSTVAGTAGGAGGNYGGGGGGGRGAAGAGGASGGGLIVLEWTP